ncbi:CaiF/GrlA family transcriptional regulator [Salmonella enterica subsp. enterica serovar Stanley]|nr:CaiF/GrlA family transcriptional regulator [Salmonella enterica subsp. enterica serovar Stanley]
MPPDKKTRKQQCGMPENDIHYPAQTNHDVCYVPESVRQYASEPLYILVAHWCAQQQDWVQRNQISEAFHITARRASYLMAYLRSKTSRVVSVSRHQMLPNKARRYEIFVIRVLEKSPSVKHEQAKRPPLSRHRVGNADTSQARELWNRLSTQRRAGKLLKNGEDDD